MTNAKWMMVGLLLGLSASTVLSCGPAVKACGPKECPFGCCDERGSCQVGSSDSQCGAQGSVCSACMLAQRCQLGLCTNIGSGGGGGGGGSGGGSGGGVTGGGTGGGVTGGGTGGGGTTCGPGNCNGCCRLGSCVQPPNNGNNTTCGLTGGTCADCAALSAICSTTTFTCVFGPAGGGGGATGGGGGTTTCSGCMNGTACVPYGTSSQFATTCGGGGAPCGTCTGICSAGNCTTSPPAGIISSGRVRLVDGDGLTSGRLEVFANGGWGQVCDDNFDANLNGPNVVCRDLGFSGAVSQADATGVGDFFLLDSVVCMGTEAQLLSCAHDAFGAEDCAASEAVFITCAP